MKPFPRLPPHPERVCWGCDRYCAHTDMLCGNGSVRTPHPVELFGPNRLLDDAAAAAGTISYELLTSITPRVPRVYSQ